MKNDELRNQVTAKLVAMMESGENRPWRQPWNFGPNAGVPSSEATGKPYRGSNAVILDLTAMALGYKSKHWNTFNNWASKKIWPKQGSKATWAVWFGKRGIESKDDDGNKEMKFVPTLKSFALFNAEQCHGEKIGQYLVTEQKPENYQVNYYAFDELVAKHGIKIEHDAARAAYLPSFDRITMPAKGHFTSVEEYYATLAHELCHWCEDKAGHKRSSQTDKSVYADFELSAEIGSAYLLRELGLPAVATDRILENSAIYLKSWLSRLKSDNSYIFKVSGRAGRLVDFLMGREESEIKEEHLVNA